MLAQNNKTYAKLRFNVGPGGEMLIPVEVDYSCDFGASDRLLWDAEYQANIKAIASGWQGEGGDNSKVISPNETSCGYAMPYDFIDELENMEPAERQLILNELSERPDLWDEESEAMFL